MSLKTFFFPFAIIISTFLVIWIILPQWGEIETKKTEFTEIEKVGADLDATINKINQEIAIYETNAMNNSVIYKAMPSRSDDDVFVDEVYQYAKEKGVLITDVKISEGKALKNEVPLPVDLAGDDVLTEENQSIQEVFEATFTFEVTGNYVSSKEFIGLLEKSSRLVLADSIEMNKGEEEGATINTSISGRVFYEKEKDDLLVSSIIYSGDPIIKEISTSGLSLDFIDIYKQNINQNYAFNPEISGTGKEDLFQSQGQNQPVAEPAVEPVENLGGGDQM